MEKTKKKNEDLVKKFWNSWIKADYFKRLKLIEKFPIVREYKQLPQIKRLSAKKSKEVQRRIIITKLNSYF